MKRYGIFACLGAALLLGGCGENGAGGVLANKPKAPALAAKTLQGAAVDPAAQPGKVVLLDFWATWCGPCRESIPALQRLHDKYGGQGLIVLGVSDEDPDRVRRFVADNKMTYAVAAGSSVREGMQRYQVEALPTTVVIDKQGRVRAYEQGFAPGEGGTEAKLETLVSKLIAEK